MPILADRQQHSPLDLLSLGTAPSDTRKFLSQFVEMIPPFVEARAVNIWLANKTNGRYELIGPNSAQPWTPESPHWLDQAMVRALPADQPVSATYHVPWESSGTRRLAAQLRVSGLVIGAIEIDFDDGTGPCAEESSRITKELISHVCRAVEHVLESQILLELNNGLSRVAQADTKEDLEESLLDSAFRITGTEIGAILLLDKETGSLDVARHQPVLQTRPDLSIDGSITGQSLRKLRPRRLGDVSSNEKFKEYWPGIRSEMAIPLYVPKSSARVPNKGEPGTHLEEQPKRIGVLNLESPLIDAFSDFEEQCLLRLAITASAMLDRLQLRDLLRDLHAAESELAQHLAGGQDWLDVIKAVGDHIHTALAYSHINISLVSPDGKRIKSEYVWWSRSEQDTAKFKELSDHDLAISKDIQAEIVRTKQIEVPTSNDPRFHPDIHYVFNLDALIRVYIPLMMGDVVVGTLEAGYRRRFRQHIFERDIQILKTLGDYVAAAIWKKRRGQLDILRHEIAAPRKAVMDNALFLQRNWESLSTEKIGWKLDDIFLDGEVIDSLLDKIEYYVTGHLKPAKVEYCNVGSTVIKKIILQQARLLRSMDLDLSRIDYAQADLRIWAFVDKVKISAVFNNLFVNAIKYRKSDESLRIELAVETLPESYKVRISDYGIGIDPGYEERIFEEGVRTPSATQRAQGSGLGLWLARQYMRDMGGDVTLARSGNPTIFEIRIPKKEAQ
jgi:GAF domain-containing protein/anti-sigma regulatory factor (Ser/Thr protein kinase)